MSLHAGTWTDLTEGPMDSQEHECRFFSQFFLPVSPVRCQLHMTWRPYLESIGDHLDVEGSCPRLSSVSWTKLHLVSAILLSQRCQVKDNASVMGVARPLSCPSTLAKPTASKPMEDDSAPSEDVSGIDMIACSDVRYEYHQGVPGLCYQLDGETNWTRVKPKRKQGLHHSAAAESGV